MALGPIVRSDHVGVAWRLMSHITAVLQHLSGNLSVLIFVFSAKSDYCPYLVIRWLILCRLYLVCKLFHITYIIRKLTFNVSSLDYLNMITALMVYEQVSWNIPNNLTTKPLVPLVFTIYTSIYSILTKISFICVLAQILVERLFMFWISIYYGRSSWNEYIYRHEE